MFLSVDRHRCLLIAVSGPFATPEFHHVVLFIFGFAAVAALGVLFHRHDLKRRERRTKEMKDVASRLGFDFAESGRTLLGELGAFSLFSWRMNRRIRNVIRKRSAELELLVFDYSFGYLARNDEIRTDAQTVVCFRLRRDGLPVFRLEPEGHVMSLRSLVGFRGVTFEEPAEFKYKYALRGKEEASIRETFNESVRRWLATHDSLAMESSGDAIILFRKGEELCGDKIAMRLTEACEVVELMIPSPGPGERRLMSLASIRRDDGVSAPASDG
jgi:hypothetical protein